MITEEAELSMIDSQTPQLAGRAVKCTMTQGRDLKDVDYGYVLSELIHWML